MIYALAQAAPTSAPSLSVTALLAGLAALLGAARIFYVLSGDLASNQPVLTDPISFAVKSGTGFADIQTEKWKGLRAVIVAQQLDGLLHRYGFFLRTREGCGICFAFSTFFVVAFVYASMIPGGESAQDFLLKAAGLIALAWSVLVEKCKALKKTVENLQLK